MTESQDNVALRFIHISIVKKCIGANLMRANIYVKKVKLLLSYLMNTSHCEHLVNEVSILTKAEMHFRSKA